MNRRKFFNFMGKLGASLALLIAGKPGPKSQEDSIKASVDMAAIDDIDVVGFVRSEFRKAMDAELDRHFIELEHQFLTGDGTDKPLGILNNASFPRSRTFRQFPDYP